MKTPEFSLERYQGDKETLVIVCDKCKAKGSPMSRNWNWDAKARCWEPQERHFPDCKHFAETREKAQRQLQPLTTKET